MVFQRARSVDPIQVLMPIYFLHWHSIFTFNGQTVVSPSTVCFANGRQPVYPIDVEMLPLIKNIITIVAIMAIDGALILLCGGSSSLQRNALTKKIF